MGARIKLAPGARPLAQTMRRAGAYEAPVSAGFAQFTAVIAARLGFEAHRALQCL